MSNQYFVSACFPSDDVPVFSSDRESACVDFVLRHSTPGTFDEVHALAEKNSGRAIENSLLGYDIYQMSPVIALIAHDELPQSGDREADWDGEEFDVELDDEDDIEFDFELGEDDEDDDFEESLTP